jgi:hypothetical protein
VYGRGVRSDDLGRDRDRLGGDDVAARVARPATVLADLRVRRAAQAVE